MLRAPRDAQGGEPMSPPDRHEDYDEPIYIDED